jgi:Uma2 family endonuclease
MATPTLGLDPETVELRQGVDWDTYVRLNDSIEGGATRLTFHKGQLEIMTVSRKHEGINRFISDLVTGLAVGLEMDFYNAGGVTHRDEEAQTGFEPDTCIYCTNLDYPFREDEPIVLPRDPAPDLIIEVDISRSSLNKMSAYAAVGCREGWRYHRGELSIYSLVGGKVQPVAVSAILPGVTASDLNGLLVKAKVEPRNRWVVEVQEWARARGAAAGSGS